MGTWQMVLNLAAVTLFSVSWLTRTHWGAGLVGLDSWVPELTAFLGLAVLIPSGWLGGSLVYVHGVGVEAASARPGSAGRRAA